jgi:hypothetical protein
LAHKWPTGKARDYNTFSLNFHHLGPGQDSSLAPGFLKMAEKWQVTLSLSAIGMVYPTFLTRRGNR